MEEVGLGFKPSLRWNPEVEDYLSKAYGLHRFNQICHSLTRPSLHSCIRVNTLQTSRKDVIEKLGEILNEQYDDASTGTKTVTDGCGSCYEHPLLTDTVLVKGEGPININYDTEGGPLKEVIVSRKCAEAVLRGANVFVPGVLACSGHVESGDMVAVSVAVEHLNDSGNWVVGITRGTVLSSEHAKSQKIDPARKDLFIGRGRALLSRSGMFRERQGVAVEMSERVYKHLAFHGILKGEMFLQNLPSIVAAKVLDPKPGERIYDMCAAPGGKTTAIASLMGDIGDVIATDRSHNKVAEILRLAKELNLKCIRAFRLDALKSVHYESEGSKSDSFICMNSMPNTNMDNLERLEDLKSLNLSMPQEKCPIVADELCTSKTKPKKQSTKLKNGPGRGQNQVAKVERVTGFKCNSFDRVLLDAPCSALGLRPRLFAGEDTLGTLRRHSSYQRRLFDQAVQLVRPGGVIVYSTCTINPGENEAVVRYALNTYKFLSLTEQDCKIGGPGLCGGLDIFDGMSYKEWLREDEQHLVQRFDPSSTTDTIGFFIAKFQVGSK